MHGYRLFKENKPKLNFIGQIQTNFGFAHLSETKIFQKRRFLKCQIYWYEV